MEGGFLNDLLGHDCEPKMLRANANREVSEPTECCGEHILNSRTALRQTVSSISAENSPCTWGDRCVVELQLSESKQTATPSFSAGHGAVNHTWNSLTVHLFFSSADFWMFLWHPLIFFFFAHFVLNYLWLVISGCFLKRSLNKTLNVSAFCIVLFWATKGWIFATLGPVCVHDSSCFLAFWIHVSERIFLENQKIFMNRWTTVTWADSRLTHRSDLILSSHKRSCFHHYRC